MTHLLDSPRAYIAFQHLLGAVRARRSCIERYAKPTEGMRVLDLGCGPGHMVTSFPGAHYVGVDVNRRYIDFANTHYGDRGLFRCTEISEENIREYREFDLVLLLGVLHHLSDRAAAGMLSLLGGSLRSGGRLMTLDGYYHPGMSRFARLLLRFDRGSRVRTEEGYVGLARSVFPRVVCHRHDDLSRVPCSWLVLVCESG
jgi:SAM-dependent methyltransferase